MSRALQYLEAVAAKARNHEPDRGYIGVMNLKMNFLADPRMESGRFKAVLDRIRGDSRELCELAAERVAENL